MAFWIVPTLMALAVAGGLILVLNARRNLPGDADAAPDLHVYREQLNEVDRDLARGVIAEEDAERARTEISRRILAADATARARTAKGAPASRKAFGAGVFIALVVLGGSGLIYSGSASVLRLMQMPPERIEALKDRLTVQFNLPGRDAPVTVSAVFDGLGSPGYGDLALARRIEEAARLRANRPSQVEAETDNPRPRPMAEITPDYLELVVRLRETVTKRPDDLRGQRLLARHEAAMGNYKAAYAAQARVIDLKGDQADAGDIANYADLLILAADGYVSPEAEGALAVALQRDRTNPIARYYWGQMLAQTGRPDLAFQIWRRLLDEGPPDAAWIAPVRAQIEDAALAAGVRYQLPPLAPSARGPDAADIAAAAEMTDEEREQMIRGMVEGLSTRLAEEGGAPEEWARLINALGVLGKMEDAARILGEARAVYAEDEAALETLNRAAARVGLGE